MRKTLLTALAAAVLVVLLASAQGTAALLRAESQLTPGTITTGKLALQAGNGNSSSTDFVFADLSTKPLVPGGYLQAPLTISNTGTVYLNFSLAGAISAPSSPTPADTALASAVDLTIHAVADTAACQPDALTPGPALYQGKLSPTASFSPRHLAAQGASSEQTLCVRISLPSGTDSSAAGGKLKLVLSWRGDQA
ncbi:hypothetical protein [Arthrobacter glacialis]|uniref:hypothetical protein n=1 Tax=Arthrobacter glacialis TaxID=1664 RepID=UPI001056FF06|nr:hypothetical protein [Arthrobacter glacialis]